MLLTFQGPETAASIYQEYLSDDVPAPPLIHANASIAVQPLSVGGTENVAYANTPHIIVGNE
jgi:hypothetical protein